MAAATTATAKTVSQPLQLNNGDSASQSNGNKRRRVVKPSGKVTLTSLTENNVSRQAIVVAEALPLMGRSRYSSEQ